jgi:hypothetical protein
MSTILDEDKVNYTAIIGLLTSFQQEYTFLFETPSIFIAKKFALLNKRAVRKLETLRNNFTVLTQINYSTRGCGRKIIIASAIKASYHNQWRHMNPENEPVESQKVAISSINATSLRILKETPHHKLLSIKAILSKN